MRTPNPLWQRIALAVGIALAIAVGNFVGWNLSWLSMGFPEKGVVAATLLNWMQGVPAVAAGIWTYMRVNSGQTTNRHLRILGVLVAPVSFAAAFYSFLILEKTGAGIQTRIILLAALSAWSVIALWTTGQFKSAAQTVKAGSA